MAAMDNFLPAVLAGLCGEYAFEPMISYEVAKTKMRITMAMNSMRHHHRVGIDSPSDMICGLRERIREDEFEDSYPGQAAINLDLLGKTNTIAARMRTPKNKKYIIIFFSNVYI